ncbi:alpha/beta hydrolase fold domain-containing protein [Lacunimicrobium album]
MKTLILGLIATVLLPASAFAQDTSAAKEKIQQRCDNLNIDVQFDQAYAGNNNPRQALDIYLPKSRKSEKPIPVVVYIHGGAWISGDKLAVANRPILVASTGQYAGISVAYRLSNEAKWPAQIHDCKAAIRWVRGNAEKLGLDADHIAVWGTSAGGHLVSMLGTSGGVESLEGDLGPYTDKSSRVTCVIDECGPTDFELALTYKDGKPQEEDVAVVGLLGGKLADHVDLTKSSSPVTYVTPDDAPFLILHGTKDLRVDFSHATRIDKALEEAGVSSILIPVTDVGHSLGHPKMIERIKSFVDHHLYGLDVETPEEPLNPIK